MNIGYCTSCTYTPCPTPNIRQQPGANCSFWTDGKPVKVTQRDSAGNNPKYDHFKGIKAGGHETTRRLDECPKCSGNMPGLTCSDCGYQFELETA